MEAFKSLEILIGVGGVMLLLSLLVTALTHMTVDVFRLRALHLEQGVTDLFRQLGWDIGSAKDVEGKFAEASELAKLVLRDCAVITREEFVENLLKVAVHSPALRSLMPGDPALLLEDLRHTALQISTERPDLAAASVKSIALARGPAASLVAEIFSPFDSAMDRVSARFTSSSRIVVCVFAVIVAVALPLDTFDLFRRFSTSEEARAAAVQMASSVASTGTVVSQAVVQLPQTLAEWRARWAEVNLAGVCASALLLSLGAPFWFDLLKDLLRLRSSAAGQEERDRIARLTAQDETNGVVSVGGEKGDLNALGRLR